MERTTKKQATANSLFLLFNKETSEAFPFMMCLMFLKLEE